ncbi:MAG: Tripartite-type tricarboxylate transporter, receptor component TctC [Tardiphaga sp.]|nr:Tripartite-type tricarboxylate transporter, receptor component TctC [Tardiphaga sp.]
MIRPITLAFLFVAMSAGVVTAADSDYPKRPIRLIVPFPAGAGPDQVARMLGQHLQDTWGQTVVIENRAGALGSIGAQEVARSAPDGYTLMMGTNTTQAANVAMLKNLPYDPAKDFAPIMRTVTTAMVLVVKPDFPAQNLSQFMDYARAHPNMTGGYGSGASQISIAQLQTRGRLSVVAASYRGVPQAITDVMGGVIDLAFADFSLAIPQMQGGTLRGLGVTSPNANDLTPGFLHSRKRCRASRPRSGTDCWRRQARRPPSSTRSTLKASNSCRCPRHVRSSKASA